MSIRFVERLSPIYMIGDSQCLIFNNLHFEATWQEKSFSLVTQAKYCPGIAANNFSNDQGKLHPHLIQALMSECLIDSENQALYQFKSHLSSIITLLSGRVVTSPVLVFFCGGADIVNIFLKYLTTQYDFYLPGQETLLAAFEPFKAAQSYPYETARSFADKLLSPFFRGLLELRQMGFEHFYVHNIPPFSMDDEEFSRLYEYRCPAYIRYKSLLLFNQILAEKCEQHQIGFINTWDDITQNNQLNPDYYLDTIHPNKEAAFLSMGRLWGDFTQHVDQHYVTQSNQSEDLYEQLIALTVQIFVKNHRPLEVLASFHSSEPILKQAIAQQLDLKGKIPFIVSCLYYIAGAFYALNNLPGLKGFLKDYRVLLQEYKPPQNNGLNNVGTRFGLIYSDHELGNLSLTLPRYYLLGASPELLAQWQVAYPKIHFERIQFSIQELSLFKPYLMQAEVYYLPEKFPLREKDAIIFALIEGLDVQTYTC